jgi:membrane fusion protein (multidrug efflux system)
VQMATAELENAQARLETARIEFPARLAAAEAELAAAEAARTRAEADYRRQIQMPRAATTQEAIDAATAARLAAIAQVDRAQAAKRQAGTVRQSIAAAEANVQQLSGKLALARAALEQAELNLSWTRLTAPQDGWITRRNVEQGSYVQPGQAVFAIVTPDVWVTANFKESDLDRIRPGETVEISVDAYPKLHLRGHVDSIQLGSGSRFTAFPPENATGNFVKIVQRVPVKIIIDSGMDPLRPLPLGVSVVPTVRVR